jgi:hypothetical protein
VQAASTGAKKTLQTIIHYNCEITKVMGVQQPWNCSRRHKKSTTHADTCDVKATPELEGIFQLELDDNITKVEGCDVIEPTPIDLMFPPFGRYPQPVFAFRILYPHLLEHTA